MIGAPYLQVYADQVVTHVPAVACLDCGDMVLGAELDERGRCPACGPAVLVCSHCGDELLAERAYDAGGDDVCGECADAFDEALEERARGDECCNGSGCARCV